MKKPDGWCCTHHSLESDLWYGVFETRETAISFARDRLEVGDGPLFAARTRYLDPVKYAPELDVQGLIETMTDDAESDYGGDDPPFALLEGAEEALASAIRAWVEEYVEPVGWSVVEGTVEEVRS